MSIRKSIVILCLVLIPAFSSNAVPTERFISPKGNDSAPGTALKPWKTLAYALGQVQLMDGDVRLIVEDGEYQLAEPLVLNGIGGRSVTIEAAPGAAPVLRGDRRVVRLRRTRDGKMLEANLSAAGLKDLGNPCERQDLVDLYWKGERQRLARYPDEGFIYSGEAIGPTRIDDITRKEGIFRYKEDRISGWAGEKDAWIYGYYRWDWSDQYQKVEAIDVAGKSITLGGTPHGYGYKSGFRYYGINLLCELDSPGEYYIDRGKGKLYWIPPEGYSEGDEVTVSCFGGDYMLRIEDCSDVTVEGLSFVGGRGNAVKVSGSRNVVLQNVGVSMFGGDALNVSGSSDVKVDRCVFSTLGHSGIKMDGGDRKTIELAGYSITNTVIKDFSLFKHTYEPAVFFKGCGLTIAHCEFFGSSSSAMRIDGSEALVEFNHFHDLVRESDDQGGLDMFYNYGYRGVVVRYNLWENILGGSLHGAAGVRFDDMISGQTVYGNIFRNVGAVHFGAVQIHGGKDNVVENNLFFHCNIGVSFSPWGQAVWDRALEREEVVSQLHDEIDIDGPLYTGRYPDLKVDIHDHVDRNIIRNNIAVGCRRMFYDEKGQNLLENNHGISIGEDPVTESLGYYLSPEVLAGFGLKPIPYKEIGPEGSVLDL